MLEFKVIQELKPNTEILEIIKSYTYITKNGKVKHLLKTNLQFIEPTQYIITYPTTLTILEYKVTEISNKPFYIKEHKKALYTELLMKDLLTEHLISVSKISEDLLNSLMEDYKKSDERLSEKNKKINHLEWAKLMNNYKNTAEEIILKEYIFI